jgi:hypothetical protein
MYLVQYWLLTACALRLFATYLGYQGPTAFREQQFQLKPDESTNPSRTLPRR